MFVDFGASRAHVGVSCKNHHLKVKPVQFPVIFFLGGGGIETQLSTVKSYILETNSAVIVEIESVFEDFTALGARIPSRFVAFHSQMAPQTVLSFVRFGALRTHVFG